MENLETAILAGGCFWCTEAVFDAVEGVEDVVSGYSGGHKENPTYQEVCSETTGHAEAVKIEFDPSVISFKELLQIFFATHDPTTLNRQGNDIGESYRSAIFCKSEEQKESADKLIEEIENDGIFSDPVVTEVTEFTNFYPAEGYHQNYYANNPNQGYCAAVVGPKVAKFRKVFADKLKK